MKWKDILIVFATVLILLVAGVLFAGKIFDTSHEEELAKGLVGKPWSEVERVMGKPFAKYDSKSFNEVEIAKIRQSWSPREIPVAHGETTLYYPKITLIILYEKDGKVEKVYVGRT